MFFGNSQNWSLFYHSNYTAHFLNADTFESMSEKPIPILIQYPLIAVLVKTHTNHPLTWRYGGKIKQYLKVNILDANVITSAVLKEYPLILDQVNLIFLERLNLSDSAITYIPPKWFFQSELTIWQYTENFAATIDDKIEEITAIAQSIDTKINAISTTISTTDLYGLP